MANTKRSRLLRFLSKFIFVSIFITLVCIFFYNADINLTTANCFLSSDLNNISSSSFRPDNTDKFLFYVMSTGNSESFLFIDPNGQTMLIDAADDDDYPTIKSALTKYGVDKINTLVATHPHADHIGSMDDIINSYNVDILYMTNFSDDTSSLQDFTEAIDSLKIDIIIAESGMKFKCGDASVLVLGPERSDNEDNANNESIVLLVSYEEIDFLMTGDMEEKEALQISERWGRNVDCEILKVAHHGSQTATTKAFLELTTPDIAVISCGENNPYGHPSEAVLALLDTAGATTLRTDQMGDIAIVTDGTGFETYTQFDYNAYEG